MHPRLLELVHYAIAQREALLQAVHLVPVDAREGRRRPGTWSVAEVLEHLHRVETGIARVILRTIERASVEGIREERETESLLHSLDSLRLLERDRHLSAPESVAPRGEFTSAQGLSALASSREAFLTAVRTGDRLALGSLTFPHPLLGPLNLYQWILFVGQHEKRHAAQIAEIAGDHFRSP
jgi:hypothetical protein